MGDGEAASVTFYRRVFNEDGGLHAFESFLDERYGDQLVDAAGDLAAAVEKKREIDATYELEDAVIEFESYGVNGGDDVELRVYADDPGRRKEIRDTIQAKAEGRLQEVVEDGIVKQGERRDLPERHAYYTVEPFAGIETVLRDWYGQADEHNITLRPLDDEVDERVGKRVYGKTDSGEEYLSEGTFDIVTERGGDEIELQLHVTQQNAKEDYDIEFRVETDPVDLALEEEAYRLIHGRCMAMTDQEDTGTGMVDGNDFIAAVDDVSLDDVGGLDDVKSALLQDVILPLEDDDAAAAMGLEPANGVLFHGPPGTGKTLLARAVAGELDDDVTMYEVNVNELVSKYVGETEQQIEELFDHAEQHSPAVMFFDEADTAMPDRDDTDKEHNRSKTNTFLHRMDGFDAGDDIITIAATNRKEGMDDAAYRSGRIDAEYKIGVPDHEGRKEILDIHISKAEAAAEQDGLFTDLDYDRLAAVADEATGADIAVWVENAVREAAYGDGSVDRNSGITVRSVTEDDFLAAAETMTFGEDTTTPDRTFY